jgi:hypothetical protein
VTYPSTEAQRLQLGRVVDDINADPDVDFVFHLGDIKAAGPCSTRYYQQIKRDFDRFQDALVYTFGDNEWADCSRAFQRRVRSIGAAAALRQTFIPSPGSHPGPQHDRDLPGCCRIA